MRVPLTPKVSVTIWATPPTGKTLEELITRMEELNNPVLHVDRENNRIQVHYSQEE